MSRTARIPLFLFTSILLLFAIFWFSPVSHLPPSLLANVHSFFKHQEDNFIFETDTYKDVYYDEDSENQGTYSRTENPVFDEKDVVVLTEKNFSDFIATNPYVMVDFYASWCFWSRKLAPEYSAAATLLKGETVLAKVEATEEPKLARKYNIQGYPTMHLFVGGVQKDSYYDERTREAIATWMRQKTGLVVQTVSTAEEAKRILRTDSVIVMGFLDTLEGSDTMELAAASKLHADINFYQTDNVDVARLFRIDPQIKPPALVLLKWEAAHRSHVGFDGQFTKSEISDFVSTNNDLNTTPEPFIPMRPIVRGHDKFLFDEKDVVGLTEKNFSDFVSSNQCVMLNFYAPWCVWSQRLAPEYSAAATMLKGEAVFAKIDATNEIELGKMFKIEGYPTMYLLIDGGVQMVTYDSTDDKTSDAIATWVRQKMSLAVQNVTTIEEAERILAARSVLVMGFFDTLEGSDSKELAAVAKQHIDVNFYQTANAEVASLFQIDPQIKHPALIMLKRKLTTTNHSHFGFDGQFTTSEISNFISEKKLPSVITFTEDDALNILKNPMKQVRNFITENELPSVITFPEEDAPDILKNPMKQEDNFIFETDTYKEVYYDEGSENHATHSRTENPVFDEKEDVVVLTEKNFSDFIATNPYVMVDFYASWCFWSRKLAPEYSAAATLLKGETVLAKVEATEEPKLARKYNIQGYPTMHLFVGGVQKDSYYGERTREAIATWMRLKTGLVVQTVSTAEEAKRILRTDSVIVMGFLDTLEGSDTKELAAASKLHADINFYQTDNVDVARLFRIDPQIKPPALVLLKWEAADRSHVGFDGQFTKSEISDFVSTNNFQFTKSEISDLVSTNNVPSVITFSVEDASRILGNPTKQLWLFSTKYSLELISTFEEAAKDFGDKLLFVYAETDDTNVGLGANLAFQFGVPEGSPRVVACMANGDMYLYHGELTFVGIKSFAEEFLEDNLSILSVPISKNVLRLPSDSH